MDIKDLSSDIAEEIAVKLYGKSYYDLNPTRQEHVFSLALLDASDKLASISDDLVDRWKEEQDDEM